MAEEKKDKPENVEEAEDDPEEQVEFLGKAPKRKDTRVTFYHPPLPLPTKKFASEDKKENELL